MPACLSLSHHASDQPLHIHITLVVRHSSEPLDIHIALVVFWQELVHLGLLGVWGAATAHVATREGAGSLARGPRTAGGGQYGARFGMQ